MRDLGRVGIRAYEMTLLSDDQNTTHTWPWGGKILKQKCEEFNWYRRGSLPKTSVIITFIDRENLITLLRTVHSILKYTPKQLLHEVILIEDNCKNEEFHSVLDIYLGHVFGDLVRVVRNEQTLGLIKARLQGVRTARGDVVVCMDSHVEVSHNWLEPLLYEIVTKRQTLSASHLDWLEKKGNVWHMRHGGSNWKTYFDMNLVFGFQEISKKQSIKQGSSLRAIESPVTVGTLWAMDRQYFFEVGAFDEGMELWGGENLDLPIRVWLMGGRVVNVPCSHVAHIEKTGYRDYRDHWSSTINRNYKRFIMVWMPSLLQYFNSFFDDFQAIEVGDLGDRIELRKKAKYDLDWYLTNVFPELGIPQIHGTAWGKIRNTATDHCLGDNGDTVQLYTCRDDGSMIYFLSKKESALRSSSHVYNVKKNTEELYRISREPYITLYATNQTTEWSHQQSGYLKLRGLELCLQARGHNLVFDSCNATSPHQQWKFDVYP